MSRTWSMASERVTSSFGGDIDLINPSDRVRNRVRRRFHEFATPKRQRTRAGCTMAIEHSSTQEHDMPQFIIERHIDGASTLSASELTDIAAKSNEVVDGLGVPYRWVTSYVAGDKIYCVHEADSADVVREHARGGGFPADVVVEVAAVIGPETAGSTV